MVHRYRHLAQGFGAGLFWGGSGNFVIRSRLLVKENIILEFVKTDYELSKIRSNTCTCTSVHVGVIFYVYWREDIK